MSGRGRKRLKRSAWYSAKIRGRRGGQPQYAHIELGNSLFGHSRGLFHVERGDFERVFRETLASMGFDCYGHYGYDDDGNRIEDAPHRDCVKKCPNKRRDFGFENDTFILRPYYWGGNSRAARRPNFVFKPTGFQLKWYKYPLRDAYANMNLTLADFEEMLKRCVESVAVSAASPRETSAEATKGE